MYSDIE